MSLNSMLVSYKEKGCFTYRVNVMDSKLKFYDFENGSGLGKKIF